MSLICVSYQKMVLISGHELKVSGFTSLANTEDGRPPKSAFISKVSNSGTDHPLHLVIRVRNICLEL